MATDMERELTRAVRAHRAKERDLANAAAERDRMIRAAIEASVPRHRIIAITELSFQRIDQIRRGR